MPPNVIIRIIMSDNQFAKFLDKVTADPALQESLKSETDLFAAGAKAGFTFTQEDIDAVKVSIDDDQLAGVSAGGDGATLGWAGANIFTLGLPIIGDALFNDSNITKAAQNA